MVVAQLIEELSKLDPNTRCYAYALEEIQEVTQVTVNNKTDNEDEQFNNWVYCMGDHPLEYNKETSIVIIGGR